MKVFSTTIGEPASGPGSGDVIGPSSSTDNALARFDGTTGKLIQNSIGVLSDAGVLTGLTGLYMGQSTASVIFNEKVGITDATSASTLIEVCGYFKSDMSSAAGDYLGAGIGVQFGTVMTGANNFTGANYILSGVGVRGVVSLGDGVTPTGNNSGFMIGGFFQVTAEPGAGDSSTMYGIFCGASGEAGYDGDVGSLVGGSFSATIASDSGTVLSATGGSFSANTEDGAADAGLMIGGLFTISHAGAGAVTTACSGHFAEPINDGAGSITNKVAVFVDGTESVSLSSIASSASITNMTVDTSFVRITGSTATSIHGIHADTFEKKLEIYNQTSVAVTIKHQSGTEGTAANRIICPGSSDVVLLPGRSSVLHYEATQSRWIVILIDNVYEYDAGNSSTAITVNWNNGETQKVTMTGNATATLSTPVAGKSYLLRLLQDATGSRTITFSPTVNFPGATTTPPTLSGANRTDFIELYYDGSAYWGTYVLNY